MTPLPLIGELFLKWSQTFLILSNYEPLPK
jgi:hypothetical protein